MLSWALGRHSEHSLSGAPVPHAGLGVRVLPATSSAPMGAGSGLTALLELPRAAGEERSLFFFLWKGFGSARPAHSHCLGTLGSTGLELWLSWWWLRCRRFQGEYFML